MNVAEAELTPAEPRSSLAVGELNAFMRNLPSLGDDADGFAQDVRAIRAEFPAEGRVHRTLRWTGMSKQKEPEGNHGSA